MFWTTLTFTGGLRFYDRVEVKTILDYLRVINQPDNNDALSRVINTPSRRIGEATIKALIEEADQSKITLWSLILGAVQGRGTTKTKLAKLTEKGISEFVNIILTARKKISDLENPIGTVELIKFICKQTDYENWLKDHHADVHGARWDNLQELITQAGDFQDLVATGYEDESLPEIDGLEQGEESGHLSRFLANVALASEVKHDEDGGPATAQITISTIHAAKGLEWPVVFIPATYQGSIPHSRSEDSNEERRLLYVAMTRAKALLYMSIPLKNSQGEETTLSPFLSPPSLAPLLDQRGPSLQSSTIQSISQILRRPLPSAESISKSAADLHSVDDDLFPVGDEDIDMDNESRYSTNWNTSYTRGQKPAKRQRIELGRSTSNVIETKSAFEGYRTTMDRASTFTVGSMDCKTTFVSAGSLPVLSEQSINRTVSTRRVEDTQNTSKTKASGSGRQTGKGMDGQGTLFGFLGKPEPRTLKRLAPSNDGSAHLAEHKYASEPSFMSRDIHKPRLPSSTGPVGISPAFSNHRLGVGQTIRPKPALDNEQHKRNDYVFLSSSPPRPDSSTLGQKTIQATAPTDAGVKPASQPLLRPATTMHMTSVSTVQSGVHRKTLGVKRSMAGWSSQRGKGFVPPTMKRSG
jgi:DNA helicase-2/ATP-dependent DNA helicase PcrA